MITNIRFGVLGRSLLLAVLSVPWGAAQTDNQSILTGNWVVTADIYGTPTYFRMEVKQEGQKITDIFAGDKFEGSVSGNSLQPSAKSTDGTTSDVSTALTRVGSFGDDVQPNRFRQTERIRSRDLPSGRAGALGLMCLLVHGPVLLQLPSP